MKIKKWYAPIVTERLAKARDDTFEPQSSKSVTFKKWFTVIDHKTCEECIAMNGKILSIREEYIKKPPLHFGCRCVIIPIDAVEAGNATAYGKGGADWWLKHYGVLPQHYISKEELYRLGWTEGERPSKFSAGKMLFSGVYENSDGHLPQKPGRIWYEADINYTPGRRNLHRILWSNDGLIFVTYDHYETFYEII